MKCYSEPTFTTSVFSSATLLTSLRTSMSNSMMICMAIIFTYLLSVYRDLIKIYFERADRSWAASDSRRRADSHWEATISLGRWIRGGSRNRRKRQNESKYIIIYVRERLNGRNLVGLGTLGPYPAAHNCNIFVHSVYLQVLFLPPGAGSCWRALWCGEWAPCNCPLAATSLQNDIIGGSKVNKTLHLAFYSCWAGHVSSSIWSNIRLFTDYAKQAMDSLFYWIQAESIQ